MSIIFFGTFSIPSSHLFRYILFFLTYPSLIKSICFLPDGTPNRDVPCTTNSSVDYCCGEDSICLPNKVCLIHTGTFSRGSCTDQTWQSSSCPSFCLSGSSFLEVLLTFRLMTLRKSSPIRRWLYGRVLATVIRNLVLCKRSRSYLLQSS